MPDWLGERKLKTQSWQEMKETLMRLAEDQNKKVNVKTKQVTRKPVKRDGKLRNVDSDTGG